MKLSTDRQPASSPKRPAFQPFFSAKRITTPRLPIRDNKASPSEAKDAKSSTSQISSAHMEYTYRLDNLTRDGSIDIKTNFRMG